MPWSRNICVFVQVKTLPLSSGLVKTAETAAAPDLKSSPCMLSFVFLRWLFSTRGEKALSQGSQRRLRALENIKEIK